MPRTEIALLGIDPGATTGWSLATGDDPPSFGQKSSEEFLELYLLALTTGVVDRIAIERFDARRWDEDAAKTVELIGAIKRLAWEANIPLGEVVASVKVKTLKEARGRVKGKHARDAEAIRLWYLRYGKW